LMYEKRYPKLKFPKGCRVRMTRQGVRQFPETDAREGVVVGYGQFGDMLRVRRDGRRTVTTYHPDFWRKCP
jgi:hypothetical protein